MKKKLSLRSCLRSTSVLLSLAILTASSVTAEVFDPSRGIILKGTIVTMDNAGTVLTNGNLLIRNGIITHMWQGDVPPGDAIIGQAQVVTAPGEGLIYPGMINLHGHPSQSVLPLWTPPSSHVISANGRPLGTEPYTDRYEGGQPRPSGTAPQPAENKRLTTNPTTAVNSSPVSARMSIKWAEIKSLIGGETAMQGADNASVNSTYDNLLARNVDLSNFGRDRVEFRVQPIGSLAAGTASSLRSRITNGTTTAWLVHLGEGRRDGDRPEGSFSSRAEFTTLKSLNLLNEAAVIIHGTGLEYADFVEMRNAPDIRLTPTADNPGAKLVWSPTSNLLLYGRTTDIWSAIRAGILISLGTDWSPSGTRNLLHELKIADLAMRDVRILGAGREHPALAATYGVLGKTADQVAAAEIALDKLLVEMVTRNPARTLEWSEVGTITPGKVADLVLVSKRAPTGSMPDSPYRALIDATDREVELVLVGGDPLSGNPEIMSQLKPGDFEIITNYPVTYLKAIDVTKDGITGGTESYAVIEQTLRSVLDSLAGDNPPPGGGPAPLTNTYSFIYTNMQSTLPPGTTFENFTTNVLVPLFGTTPDGLLNIERVELNPILTESDDFYFRVMGQILDSLNRPADSTPPYKLYAANCNHVQPGGNPFAFELYQSRWYANCPPTASNDVAAISARGPVAIPVLNNDSDPDPEGIFVASVTDAAHGTLSVSQDGTTIYYTPEPAYSGTDSFTYTLSDSRGGTATGFVQLNVTAVPISTAIVTRNEIVPGAGVDPAIPAGSKWTSFGIPHHRAYGFIATVKPPTTNGFNGIFSGTPATLRVRTGALVPDSDGNPIADLKFKSFADPVFRSEAEYAFSAALTGAGVTSSSDRAIFSSIGSGPLRMLARENGLAPGVAGGRFASFISLAMMEESDLGAVFTARLQVGAGGVTTASANGLWAVDRLGSVRLMLRDGNPVDLGDGVVKTLKAFTVLTAVPGSPGHSRFSDGASILYRANFTDGSQSVLRLVLP